MLAVPRDAVSHAERIESHLLQSGLRYEPVGDDTWIVYPETAVATPIAVKLQDPIVLLSVPVFDVTEGTADREGLFRRLLELNAALLHSSYGLEGNRVVLSAAHPVETLDAPELQAILDDMTMALDQHVPTLAAFSAGSDTDRQP
ncbi:MAG: hypothetical protein D6705_16295 [Deltaproteobacteria bacterium]|nr:MAG: hypothetical protein D6705_16295 [Deltaproteobacteria bacterium]